MIWSDLGLRPLHYRVLWWMIDMGAMQGLLLRGWQHVCSSDLGIHRITVRRATKKLMEKGILKEYQRGTVGFVPEAFESYADASRIKIVKQEVDNKCADSP